MEGRKGRGKGKGKEGLGGRKGKGKGKGREGKGKDPPPLLFRQIEPWVQQYLLHVSRVHSTCELRILL